MRNYILGLAVFALLFVGGCRGVSGILWSVPKWVDGNVLQIYTGDGRYNGKQRWDNFGRNYQQIWNVVNIYGFNYDIRDPYLGAPFFGDPH